MNSLILAGLLIALFALYYESRGLNFDLNDRK